MPVLRARDVVWAVLVLVGLGVLAVRQPVVAQAPTSTQASAASQAGVGSDNRYQLVLPAAAAGTSSNTDYLQYFVIDQRTGDVTYYRKVGGTFTWESTTHATKTRQNGSVPWQPNN